MPTLFRLIVPVREIEQAASFYAAMLELPGERISPGRHYFRCGGTILACYDAVADGDLEEPGEKGCAFQPLPEPFYLAVCDLEEAYTRARDAGATFPSHEVPYVGPLGEIAERPWGERSVYLRDPSGNPICLVEEGTEFRS